MLSEQVYKKRQIPSSSMLKDKHGQLHWAIWPNPTTQ